jgi:hypothetical protein
MVARVACLALDRAMSSRSDYPKYMSSPAEKVAMGLNPRLRV